MLDSVGPDQTLLADRAYDSDALRGALAKGRAEDIGREKMATMMPGMGIESSTEFPF